MKRVPTVVLVGRISAKSLEEKPFWWNTQLKITLKLPLKLKTVRSEKFKRLTSWTPLKLYMVTSTGIDGVKPTWNKRGLTQLDRWTLSTIWKMEHLFDFPITKKDNLQKKVWHMPYLAHYRTSKYQMLHFPLGGHKSNITINKSIFAQTQMRNCQLEDIARKGRKQINACSPQRFNAWISSRKMLSEHH